MEFKLKTQIPFPMGLQQETAQLAQEVVGRYSDFFAWVQLGEKPAISVQEIDTYYALSLAQKKEEDEVYNKNEETVKEKWLLSQWDIEYFYGLTRPADVGCACPFNWMEKVERVVDQQYPIFGVERFPELYDKAAHMAWLIIKNQVFPDYNIGIAVLAVFVLLGRNELVISPSEEDLKSFVTLTRLWIQKSELEPEHEDAAIKELGNIIKTWGRLLQKIKE